MGVIVNSTDVSSANVGDNIPLDIKVKSARWVIVKNASGFFVNINPRDGKTYNLFPGEIDLYELEVSTQEIEATIIAQLVLQNPPATSIITVAFDQLEKRPPGTYPVMANNFVGVGNMILVAGEVLDLGRASGTITFEASPQPSGVIPVQEARISNDGAADFGDVQSDFFVQWDNAGNMFVYSFTSKQTPILHPGFQESGVGGAFLYAGVAGQSLGVMVNFKQRMTNVPSSIILTPTSTLNANPATTLSISVDGFLLTWVAPAVGQSRWIGTYTTVGN